MAGTLKPCPDSPNCVSSLATNKEQKIAPIIYRGSQQAAKNHLLEVIKNMPRSEIMTVEDAYVHVTFTSLIFRFKDDLEFEFDDELKQIHLRSASRVGHSDFGVNRKRVEEIRQRFAAP